MRLKDYLLIIPKEDFIYVGYEEGIKFPNIPIILEILNDLKKGVQDEMILSKFQ